MSSLVAAYDAAIEKGTAKAHKLYETSKRIAILQLTMRGIQAVFGVGAVGGGALAALSNKLSGHAAGILLVFTGLVPIALSALDAYNLRERYDKRWGLLRKSLDAMISERRGIALLAGDYSGKDEQTIVNIGHARLTRLEADARDWS
jgi:hypothetical protein